MQGRSGTSEDLPLYRELNAHLLGRAGMIDDALTSLDDAIDSAIAAGNLYWLPELLRRRAQLHKMRGDRLDDCSADLRLHYLSNLRLPSCPSPAWAAIPSRNPLPTV